MCGEQDLRRDCQKLLLSYEDAIGEAFEKWALGGGSSDREWNWNWEARGSTRPPLLRPFCPDSPRSSGKICQD